MIKVNDIVRFLNDVGGGRVSRIDGKTAYVVDDDGFERPTPVSQLVAVDTDRQRGAAYERPLEVKSRLVEPDRPAPKPEQERPAAPVQETSHGEQLNIVLAYEPKEVKHINTTTFYTLLVNDSNYYLHYAYMTRGDDTRWTTRAHGLLEPNMQEQLEEFGRDDLNQMTHIAVQYIAFKKDKEFDLKHAALVEQRLNVVRFFKLHSFHPNEYFDTPVLTVEITRNDRPVRELVVDSSELEQAMRQKRSADRPARRQSARSEQRRLAEEIIVQDLHIGELLDNLAGMTNADILEYQLKKFREVMDAHLKEAGRRIVFIHGKGEGVLRHSLLTELRRRYPACEAQDASFREYGFGATQVTIHHPKP